MSSAKSVSRNLRTVSLGTLLSRVLGLLRDQGLAAYFGNGPLLDAFSVAFRIPNLARVLLGEGALTTAFLPIFIEEQTHRGTEAARKLSSAVFLATAGLLCGAVVLGELGLGLAISLGELSPEALLLCQLTAYLLPYVILICLAAQQCAVLNALGLFIWPALVPVVLNAIWLFSMLTYVRLWTDPTAQLQVMCVTVLLAGCCQLALPWIVLQRAGYGWARHWRDAWPGVMRLIRQMVPVVVGLSITQLNTLFDSLVAWGLARPEDGSEYFVWWEGVRYPLSSGTASALYFGQRLYQFPLGVFGVALGTVLFPLLATHAQRKEWDRLRDDLSLGIRLVLAIGIPASAGLMLLAHPLAESLFQYGKFDADDARQTASMIAGYGAGVWAYCGLLILQRGFYAMGDRMTPLRVGLGAVVLNIVLNLTLIWPMGGLGLALSTALLATMQCLVTAWLMQDRIGGFDWRPIAVTLLKTMLATSLLALACLAAQELVRHAPINLGRAGRLGLPLLLGSAVYLVAARLIHLDEPWLLLRVAKNPRGKTMASELPPVDRATPSE
ncbi:MAG: murein biosynthesis integral membrane protein MurJ [Planctomycetaceae bacterium]